MLERLRRPSSTRAAAGSSQEVSMARMRRGPPTSPPQERAQGLRVGRPRDAQLADDGGDEPVGSHVEGGVAHAHPLWGQPPAAVVGHLRGGALLDGNSVPRGRLQIEGGGGSGGPEWKGVIALAGGDAI